MAENHTSDEEIDLLPEPETSYGKRFPRANQSDVTVASEVLRGIKLRQRKPYGQKNRCPVIINLPKPHRMCKRKLCKVASHSIPECNHCKLPPGPKSIIGLTTSRKTTRLRISIKTENKTICPLRISQLAVPSKRHCIDTWRYKSYLLPETMNICLPVTLEVFIEEESEKSISSNSEASAYSDGKLNDTEYFQNEIMKLIDNGQVETVEVIGDISNESDLLTEINEILINILKQSIASEDTINDNNDFVTDADYFENEIINIISIVCKESDDNIENNNDDSILTVEDSIEVVQLPTEHSFENDLKESDDAVAEVQSQTKHSYNLKESVDLDAEIQLPTTHSSADKLKESVDPSPEVQLPTIHSSADNLKESVDPSAKVQLPTTHSSAENKNVKSVDTLSEDTDDRSKKVMFSVFDIGKADESWPSFNFSSAVLRPSASVTKSLTSLGTFSEHDEEDFSLSIISSNVDEQENVNTAIIKNQVKHLVTSPTKPTEFANSEERSIKTSLETNNETLISLKDSISLTNSVKGDEELITAEIKTITTYNQTLHNKEVQVNTNCHDDGSQTDEIKKPNVNLGTSRQLVTSVDSELTADKFDSKNIFNSLKNYTFKTSKNMGTVTKDNKLFLVSQLSKYFCPS
ncbi:unnamed protein product [Arctia plantaginis]|uniref:Uncharacterized protein n=1 Tax=Arctia plantaginis TaxID=874455 RepID=A0A8S1A8Q4_ARCPL|nr:unnamed protein product [Arctia plantaginis]